MYIHIYIYIYVSLSFLYLYHYVWFPLNAAERGAGQGQDEHVLLSVVLLDARLFGYVTFVNYKLYIKHHMCYIIAHILWLYCLLC